MALAFCDVKEPAVPGRPVFLCAPSRAIGIAAAKGWSDFILRPLAQAALQYPDASAALLDLARANQIPDKAWAGVASAVGGAYLQYGNQIFGSTSTSVIWSDTQVRQRLALIDQLLAATTSPTAYQALQSARTSLLCRLK